MSLGMLQYARPSTTNTWRGDNEEGILFGIGNSAFGWESQRHYERFKEAHSASATHVSVNRFEHLDIDIATVVLVLAVHRLVSAGLADSASRR